MPDRLVTLLIVGDDILKRTSLSRVFSELGYSVRTAEDGSSALLKIRHDLPDILLSDLDMPGTSGLKFLLTVRRDFPSIRVLAMGGGYSGNGVPPGVAADAFYQEGTGTARLIQSVDAMTGPGRPTQRLCMEDLFGFAMFETIPPHPRAERLTNSTGQTHYQRLGPPASARTEYSGSAATGSLGVCP
jgi:CheY-like chemotaxis protein